MFAASRAAIRALWMAMSSAVAMVRMVLETGVGFAEGRANGVGRGGPVEERRGWVGGLRSSVLWGEENPKLWE